MLQCWLPDSNHQLCKQSQGHVNGKRHIKHLLDSKKTFIKKGKMKKPDSVDVLIMKGWFEDWRLMGASKMVPPQFKTAIIRIATFL